MGALPADRIKWAYVTRTVPPEALAGWERLPRDPRVGDVGIFRILRLGHHLRMEDRTGRTRHLFVGDLLACAFGNRYATDQYEGCVPPACDVLHLMSLGGLCGMVGSRNERMPEPTLLEFLGHALDAQGRPLSTRGFRLRRAEAPADAPRPVTILIVGASMNAGKTTTCAMTIRGLAQAGRRVAAAKLTGTGANKDLQFMRDAGAELALDFTDAGWPSTYRIPRRRLARIPELLRSHLLGVRPEFLVYEIADGIFQRESALLLASPEFRAQVDHVLFAATDALSAESGQHALARLGHRLLGVSGLVSASPLGKLEVEAGTGLPCLSMRELAEGGIVRLLEGSQRLHSSASAELGPDAHWAPAPS